MGFSQDYPNVPNWIEKPEGYKTGDMVKYEGNIFKANFWASKPGEGDANENGWRLYDELYDVTSSSATEPAKVIGYIPTWRKEEDFNYAEEEMYLHITHGIVSFLMFDRGNLGEFELKSVSDVKAVIDDIIETGHRCGTKISIALGGATDYGFLDLMERVGNNPSDSVLAKAVKNVVDFVKSNDLDGIDLDLECWWDENNDASKDKGGRSKSDGPHPAGKGLTVFARELKQALPDKVISAALFATSWYGNCYDPGLAEHVEWIGVMTYDLTGSWNQSPVGPHTSLLKIREQEAYADEQQGRWPNSRREADTGDPMFNNPVLSVEDSLWYWTNPFFTNWQGKGQSIKRNKIVPGVPIYGYDFAYGKEPDDLSGQIAPGYKAVRYKDILKQFPNAATAKNANIKVGGNTPRPPFVSGSGSYPYAHNIYFETPETATKKLNLLKQVGTQGIIIWELTNDVWDGGNSIVKALYKGSGNPTKKAKPKTVKPKDPVALPAEGGISTGSTFGPDEEFGKGSAPDVALTSDGDIIEVHEGLTRKTLDVRIGVVKGNKIDWGKRRKYDTGIQASVDINDAGVVIEAHQSENAGTLWYRVGSFLDPGGVFGGESTKYDTGERPSVAINNSKIVVEVHKSERYDTLWYHVGNVNGYKVNFGKSKQYDSGIRPSIDLNNNGLVVEVHQSESHESLWYRIGEVEGRRIKWRNDEESVKFDKGKRPAVAITDDGRVIVAHQRSDTLWYRTGQVKGDTINWFGESKQYERRGVTPAIACNENIAVEVHTPEAEGALSASVLKLPKSRSGDDSDSGWFELHGKNSYSHCVCTRANNDREKHTSSNTMTVKAGAPYLYAVLTKDDDSTNFPVGSSMSVTGPDGTKYNRDVHNDNQLVIMYGTSLRCLIIKNPKPGDWKMTMAVPEDVGFRCECGTTPSKDPYKTITATHNKQKRDLELPKGWNAWTGVAATAGVATAAATAGALGAGALTLAVAGAPIVLTGIGIAAVASVVGFTVGGLISYFSPAASPTPTTPEQSTSVSETATELASAASATPPPIEIGENDALRQYLSNEENRQNNNELGIFEILPRGGRRSRYTSYLEWINAMRRNNEATEVAVRFGREGAQSPWIIIRQGDFYVSAFSTGEDPWANGARRSIPANQINYGTNSINISLQSIRNAMFSVRRWAGGTGVRLEEGPLTILIFLSAEAVRFDGVAFAVNALLRGQATNYDWLNFRALLTNWSLISENIYNLPRGGLQLGVSLYVARALAGSPRRGNRALLDYLRQLVELGYPLGYRPSGQ